MISHWNEYYPMNVNECLVDTVENCESIRYIESKLFHKNNGIKAIIAINLIEIAIFITMIKKYYFPRDQ